MTRITLFMMLLSLTACDVFRPNRGSGPRIETSGRAPAEIYDHGIRAMQRGMYDRAVEDFQELRNFHRDDPLSVKAQLALADISFRKGEYEEAKFAYQEFASYHPRHPDLDYVTFQIGLCHWKRTPKMAGRDQSLTRASVNTWTGFSNRYPDSAHQETVDRVLQKGYDRLAAKELWVARFYRKRNAWTAVESRSRYLLTRFPSSQHAEEALALLALSFQELGRPQDAASARARLEEQYPSSRFLAGVDKRLTKPPGTPPEEEVFVRPYRLPGGASAPPGP